MAEQNIADEKRTVEEGPEQPEWVAGPSHIDQDEDSANGQNEG